LRLHFGSVRTSSAAALLKERRRKAEEGNEVEEALSAGRRKAQG
jgi:hypothetical protein